MKPKIIIAISSGLVTAVATNLPECEVVVVDFDLRAHEDGPVLVSSPREQDDTFEDGKSYRLFNAKSRQDQEISNQLERINY